MGPERVFGVDFSGAIDAGRKIWIAGGTIEGDALRFDLCQRAATLPDAGPQREHALAALCAFILQQKPCVVGLDFPFGLPRTLVAEDRWENFADAFDNRYRDADTFKEACWEAAGSKELRRVTDMEAETPFSPYNLWIYRQTYYGIRDVLVPLVDSGKASVLPMQPAGAGRAWLQEICPASTLKLTGIYKKHKKYKDAKSAPVRDAIFAHLSQDSHLAIPAWIRSKCLNDKGGDARDSVIAAVATFRALRDSINRNDEGTPSLVEGFVYV